MVLLLDVGVLLLLLYRAAPRFWLTLAALVALAVLLRT